MKKLIFLLAFLFIATCGYSAEVSKQDWEEYQQYKKEQAEKVVTVSDEEYEQYQQYLKEKEQQEETNTEETINNKEEKTEKIIEPSSPKETTNKTSENEIIIGFGKNLSVSTEAKIKNVYSGVHIKKTSSNSDGWALKADYFHYLARNSAIGAGIAYDFDDFSEGLLPVDFLFKQRFPLHVNNEKTFLFFVGGLGYGALIGETRTYLKDDPSYYFDLSGGLNIRLSFGIDFTPFIIELSYFYNDIDVSTNIPNITCEEYISAFILSVGYKFTL